MKFLMAGGGTGGHVIPALAVAEELKRRGHEPFFVGTAEGLEAKLVPAAGFPIEWIEIGGLNRVGMAQRVRTLWQLGFGTLGMVGSLGRWRPAAVFSMGGYVAGPVMLAAWARRIPMVLMEPNAVPGMTNRWMGRVVARALVSFAETAPLLPRRKGGADGTARAGGVLFDSAEAAVGRADRADYGRQPRIAHAEPGGARELAAVSRSRICRAADSPDGA